MRSRVGMLVAATMTNLLKTKKIIAYPTQTELSTQKVEEKRGFIFKRYEKRGNVLPHKLL
jgi:hypothetical protein